VRQRLRIDGASLVIINHARGASRGRLEAHILLAADARRGSRSLRVTEVPALLEVLPEPDVQPGDRGGEEADRGKYLFGKARQVHGNRSGVGATTLRLNLSTFREEDVDAGALDGWLHVRELALLLPESCAREYTFPYPLLPPSSRVESLYLASCGFHPVQQQPSGGPSSSSFGGSLLSRVCLRRVGTTGEELGLFLSTCLALARLDLCDCDAVTSLEIPRALRRLSTVRVQRCRAPRAVRSDAPGLSSFHYEGWRALSAFSLGDALETRELDVYATRMADVVQYAGARLPSAAPNLETLVLSSVHEVLYVAIYIYVCMFILMMCMYIYYYMHGI
jgi:hypothetical protein